MNALSKARSALRSMPRKSPGEPLRATPGYKNPRPPVPLARNCPQPPSTSCPADCRSLVRMPRRCRCRASSLARSLLGRRKGIPSAGVEGDEVHHRVFAREQGDDAVEFLVTVVDPFQQGPLVLDRIGDRPRIALTGLDQIAGGDARRPWQQPGTQFGACGVQRQCQRRLDRALWQALEHARIADRGKHQIPMTDITHDAEQFDGLHDVFEVVGRLAHAHEHHPAQRPLLARQRDLGDDFGAAHLLLEALATGHAEHAADRAAHL
ncbi:MAG: hypothetical protein R3F18_17660 [Lysobacterales bacterium]